MSEIAKAVITLTMTDGELEIKANFDNNEKHPVNEIAKALVHSLSQTLTSKKVFALKSSRFIK